MLGVGEFVHKEVNKIAGHVCMGGLKDVVTGLRLVCRLGCGNVGEEQENHVEISARIHSKSISKKSVS